MKLEVSDCLYNHERDVANDQQKMNTTAAIETIATEMGTVMTTGTAAAAAAATKTAAATMTAMETTLAATATAKGVGLVTGRARLKQEGE